MNCLNFDGFFQILYVMFSHELFDAGKHAFSHSFKQARSGWTTLVFVSIWITVLNFKSLAQAQKDNSAQ